MIDGTDVFHLLVEASRQEEKMSLMHAAAFELKQKAISLSRELDLPEEQIQIAIDAGVEAARTWLI